MKLKFNHVRFSFFYLITIDMTDVDIDIDIEITKLNKFANNKKLSLFSYRKPFKKYNKIEYLLYVLRLTCNHPEIEIYLEQLLENFSIAELSNFDVGNTILHYMVYEPKNISLNSFEIIINFGINVNKRNRYGCVALHYISCKLLEHTPNIIALFVKYGADLNILCYDNDTVLDKTTHLELDKHLEIVIMTLIDFGAKTKNPYTHTNVLEFIESYRSSNIKPAI